MDNYCLYYRACISKKECVFFVAIMRSFDHLMFDRTYDPATSTFEFFVPSDSQQLFLKIMGYFVHTGIVSEFQQKENRLLDPKQEV